MNWGHADATEARLMRELSERVDPRLSPVTDLLHLGQLYIEPGHRGDEAVGLFEAVLARDPDNDPARLWLGFLCIHTLMDRNSLRHAMELFSALIAKDSDLSGAALMLAAEALNDLDELPLSKEIELLESSVARNPDWMLNRSRLARAYRKAGRLPDAVAQLSQALSYTRSEPDPDWDPYERLFEMDITGRYTIRKHLEDELVALQGELQ